MATTEQIKNQVAKTGVITVAEFMDKQKDLIARVLPKTITPERMLGIFTMLLKSTPALASCSQKSLIGAVIQTAQLGLQPGNIGHIHLVPFNNKGIMEAQLIIGYKGFVELVNRSGKASILTAEVVYENDFFEYEQGLNPILRHKPTDGDRGVKKGVYCIAKNLLANEKVFIYLSQEEVDKVKKASKAANSTYSPWQTWPDEMAKKTAVKRISKLLPLSAQEQAALSADETIKTKIDPEMANMPDETHWDAEDAETVVEAPLDAENEPVSPIKEAQTPVQPPSDSHSNNKRLIEAPIGSTVAEVELLVHGTEYKAVGRNGKTVFHTEDTQGQEYYIDRWGKSQTDYAGAICTFLLVKVTDYNGKRQYMADKVVVKE